MSGVSVRGVTFETEKALKKIHTQKSHIQKKSHSKKVTFKKSHSRTLQNAHTA